MQKYLFVLGKNWRLALAELDSYLQLPSYAGRIIDYSANTAIVEFEDPDVPDDTLYDLMVRLGMVQKIGRMIDFVDRGIIEKSFPKDMEQDREFIYDARDSLEKTLADVAHELFGDPKDQKIFVAVSIYPIEFSDPYYPILVKYFLQFTNKFFNKHLKELGAKKAIYYQYPQENIDKGNLNPIFPHHFATYHLNEQYRAEVLFCQTEEGMYIGRTFTVTDANFQKKLDEERPHKDFRQTIPPKFAKALLSFLSLDPPLYERKILDPFCGTGTILMFAYMEQIEVFGTDIREERVLGTRQNLDYTSQLMDMTFPKKYLEDHILQLNITDLPDHFKLESFDGIVSEPVLLPFYRTMPRFNEAQKEVETNVLPVYKQLLQIAHDLLKMNHRLAVISPIINTSEKKTIKLPLKRLAQQVGFQQIDLIQSNRISEKSSHNLGLKAQLERTLFDKGTEVISREFYILEKIS